MSDTIVYTTVSKGGGIDGMDHTDKGGNVTGAYLDKQKATKNPNAPWNTVVPIVVDLEELAKATLAKLDPVARLAVEYHLRPTLASRSIRKAVGGSGPLWQRDYWDQ